MAEQGWPVPVAYVGNDGSLALLKINMRIAFNEYSHTAFLMQLHLKGLGFSRNLLLGVLML